MGQKGFAENSNEAHVAATAPDIIVPRSTGLHAPAPPAGLHLAYGFPSAHNNPLRAEPGDEVLRELAGAL